MSSSFHSPSLVVDNSQVLAEKVSKLYNDEATSDVVFLVKTHDNPDISICAHSFVLRLFSPVFSAMLSSPMSESQGDKRSIVLEDVQEFEYFQAFMNYMYSGKISVDT